MRQELVAQINSVHLERAGLPEPLVALERRLGDGLEEGPAGLQRRILAPPDRGEGPGGAGPRIGDAQGPGVAENLPDALPPVLAVDEEAFSTGRQHADPEAPELSVSEVVCNLAGCQRPDAGVGEGDFGHRFSPGCGCSQGTDG